MSLVVHINEGILSKKNENKLIEIEGFVYIYATHLSFLVKQLTIFLHYKAHFKALHFF